MRSRNGPYSTGIRSELVMSSNAFTGATQDALLFDERSVYTRARRAMLNRLRRRNGSESAA